MVDSATRPVDRGTARFPAPRPPAPEETATSSGSASSPVTAPAGTEPAPAATPTGTDRAAAGTPARTWPAPAGTSTGTDPAATGTPTDGGSGAAPPEPYPSASPHVPPYGTPNPPPGPHPSAHYPSAPYPSPPYPSAPYPHGPSAPQPFTSAPFHQDPSTSAPFPPASLPSGHFPPGPFPPGPFPPGPFPPGPSASAPRARRRGWPALLLALACLAAGATAGAVAGNAAAGGATTVGAAEDQPVARAAAMALPSTVQIVGRDGSSGSGIVLTANGTEGTILTNAHVVDGGGEYRAVLADGSVARLSVAGTAPRADLAVLRVSGAPGLRPAQLGDSDALRQGDTVIAIGEPLGLSGSVTRGVVSALGRAVPTGRGSEVLDTIQTDAAINHGNSGGPLVDVDGRVVGISSMALTGDPELHAESLGFAIPIDHARRIADELTRTGRATLATLPVTLDDVDAPGALVTGVTPGSSAQSAGLEPGDVITRYDGQPITAAQDLEAAVQSSTPGTPVDAVVTGRDGTSRTVRLTPDTTVA